MKNVLIGLVIGVLLALSIVGYITLNNRLTRVEANMVQVIQFLNQRAPQPVPEVKSEPKGK